MSGLNKKVTIVNYNTGNIYNVARAIVCAGGDPIITADPAEILKADRLILPGVGAFKYCADQLGAKDLISILKKFVGTERPLLGICVGMQMLLEGSTEFSYTKGLNLIPGTVDNIKATECAYLKIPVFGWYKIQVQKSGDTFMNLEKYNEKYFYFVHSYRAFLKNKTNVFATYHAGGEDIPAIIGQENVMGCQFHPEKSGKVGIEMIADFLNI